MEETPVENLPEVTLSDLPHYDEDELDEGVIDLSVNLKIRMDYIHRFYKDKGYDIIQELVNKLSGMYQLSGTSLLKEYLFEISTKSKLHIDHKVISAKGLCFYNKEDDLGYKAINEICKSKDFYSIPTPCQIELICILIKHKKYKKQSKKYFCQVINNDNIEVDYRYKAILNLEQITDDIYFIRESCLEFIDNKKNMTRYRILAGQCLLKKCQLPSTKKTRVENYLIQFAQDNELDHNIRADAADVLLQVGSKKNAIIARDIIICLGREGGIVRTIFDNSQNVHTEQIDQSLYAGLEFLTQVETQQIEGLDIDYLYVKKQIDDYIKQNKINDEMKDKIEISLNRIFMDRALYGPYNMSLMFIIIKVFSYINNFEDNKQEIFKRLIEELSEMSGTCSSGYATRLVNVMSGFGDFNYRISWRDQVVANFVGRLNARARDIKDEDFQGKVLEEMSINSSNYYSRKNFNMFFRQNVLGIREELWEEFKKHMSETDFDLSFRAAILTYENGRNN